MGRILYKGDNYTLYDGSARRINAMLPKAIKGKIVCGIYKMSFCEYFYVGRSCNIKDRIRCHIQSLDKALSKERMSEPYQKNMVTFLLDNPEFNMIQINVLEECKECELNEREQAWINKFKDNPKMMNGTMVAAKNSRDKVWEEFDPSLLYPVYFKIERFEDYLQYKKLIKKGNPNISLIIKK